MIEKGNKRFYIKSFLDQKEIPTDVIIRNKERKLIECTRFLFIIYVFENFNFPPFIISKFHEKLGILLLTKRFTTREIIKGRINFKLITDEFQKVYFTGKCWLFSISTNWFEFKERERKKSRREKSNKRSRLSSETFFVEKSVLTFD